MLLVFTHKITPRLTYTFKHVCKHILGLEVKFTSKIEEFIAHKSLKMSYTKQPLSNEFFIKCHDLLFETSLSNIDIHVQDWDSTKGFFACGEKSDLPFDIFAASFYLLSRYEEYLPHVKDTYGRFLAKESLAYKNAFIHQPVIDIWAYKFKAVLAEKFTNFKFQNRSYNIQPIIDVPIAFKYKHKGLLRTIGGTLVDIWYLRYKELYERYQVLINLKKDPYNTFKWINFMQKKFYKKFIVFFLLGKYSNYDKNISTNNKSFSTLIKSVADYCIVGLKVSYIALDNLLVLKREKEKIEGIINRELSTVRHSFSKLNLPSAYRNLIELEIYKDFSMGYVDTLGFRASTCTPFYFYDFEFETETPLQINPYQCLDHSLLQYKSQLDKTQNIQKIIKEIKAVNGTFTFIFHNYSFSETTPWKGFKTLFKLILHSEK